MKPLKLTLTALVLVTGVSSGSVLVDPAFYTGWRNTDTGNGLVGNSAWAGDGSNATAEFEVRWEITSPAADSTWWTYKYWVDGVSKSPSHATLELSDIFATEPDRLRFPWGDGSPPTTADFESAEIKTYSPGAPSDPGLLAEFFGIKVNSSKDDDVFAIWFESTQAPMWGDFYAKDGKHKGADVFAQNTGIGTEPDLINIANQEFTAWVPVPDTVTTSTPEVPTPTLPPPVSHMPEPSRALLIIVGASISLFRRRR